MSNYRKDISKEEFLGNYLDTVYPKLFDKTHYSVKRINNLGLQHKGVDLLLENAKNKFYVDEKAQLDYLNVSLKTFAFELSYLKFGGWREGWLFDNKKITEIYFLITEIKVVNPENIYQGIQSLKITGIYRSRLLKHLEKIGLTKDRLLEIEKELRNSGLGGRTDIKELNSKIEGNVNLTLGKSEKPINLVLKLDYLIKHQIGAILIQP